MPTIETIPIDEIVKIMIQYIAYLAEGLAALIIIIGSLQAIWIYFRRVLFTSTELYCKEITQSRIQLGHSLSLGLEFLIGADILKTAVAPAWQDIGQLAAIVAIRTVLNFFLMRELGQSEKSTED
ncbi:DUF1622 domain-containing protein [bacterium]|nr:DUF1622 domain-containing protein [bacterium]